MIVIDMKIKIDRVNVPIYQIGLFGQEIMVSQDLVDRWTHVSKLFRDSQGQMRSMFEYAEAEEQHRTEEAGKVIEIDGKKYKLIEG